MQRREEGYFNVVRQVFWHPAFRKPSEGGLFVFLVSEARWQDGWERTARGSVALKRGQVLICEAELAELWDFHRNKLRRVLRSMADHRIITMGPLRHGDIQGTLITILNYDKYQYGGGADPVGLKGTGTAPGPRRDGSGTTPGPRQDHARTTPCESSASGQGISALESREEREERESNQKASPSGPPELPSDLRAWVWRDGLAIVSAITGLREKSARSLLGRLLAAAGEDHERLWCVLLDGQSKHPLMDAKAWLMAAAKGGGAVARQRPGDKYDASWSADLLSPSLGGRGIGGVAEDPGYDLDGAVEPVG